MGRRRPAELPKPAARPSVDLKSLLLLFVLTFAAYLPALAAGFVWDDDAYVSENGVLRSLHGLSQIWFQPGATVQYYPLVFSSFWIEYHLWGLSPAGYHLVNILLHAAAAILFWRILVRLDVPGAWLAGAIFALHPVHVESVAWVTERKNVLSTVFYLLAMRSFLLAFNLDKHAGANERAQTSLPQFLKGAAFFVCALLSKTATVGLQVVLILIFWWKRRRLGPALALSLPLFVAALLAGAMTSYVEKHHVGAGDLDWNLTGVQHVILAGQSVWLYLGKLVWPVNLAFVYNRWPVNVDGFSLLYPIGVAALVALAAWLGRGVLVAILIYLIGLGPALGFIPFYFMRYSWVADHFQYVASLGPIALIAALIARACQRSSRPAALPIVSAAIIVVLGGATFVRAGSFHDLETLWNDVIAKSPSARPQAHQNLAVYCNKLGRTAEEVSHYQESLKLRPNEAEPRCNLAIALYTLGRRDEAMQEMQRALQLRPDYPEAESDMGFFLQESGRLAESEKHYRRAIAQDPNFAAAHFNLARLLVQLKQYEAAAQEYGEVLRITPQDAEARADLDRLIGRKPG